MYDDVTDPTMPIPKDTKRKMYEELASIEAEISRLEGVLLKISKETPNFPGLFELMRKVRQRWQDTPPEYLNELASIFAKGVYLRPLPPHLWEMRIKWKLWGQDNYIIWQSNSSHLNWSKEEEHILKSALESGTTVQDAMQLLPRFSPDSLRTKCLQKAAQKAPVFLSRG
jgi:hypothetical protein